MEKRKRNLEKRQKNLGSEGNTKDKKHIEGKNSAQAITRFGVIVVDGKFVSFQNPHVEVQCPSVAVFGDKEILKVK